MRYQNWDILVFPDLCKIPLQEFKTACQVIQDPESHSFQSSQHLLPTITCFIPGLPSGTPFRVSIHCWQNPEVSRYVQSFKKPGDHTMFEARLFLDGRVVGSKLFHQFGPWPTVLDLSIDLNKNGELEKLKFPTFHKELLMQSHWSAGDDLGRIKLIVSEGFTRDNMTYSFERIKNIASFSFQHAPLEVLESSSIAWPNAAMWRQAAMAPYGQQVSPRKPPNGPDAEAHSHSPRHGSIAARMQPPVRGPGVMPPPPTIFPRHQTFDPFTDQVHAAFIGYRQTSGDISMPDYSSSSSRSRANSTRQVTDPMSITAIEERGLEPMPDDFVGICERLIPSAPVNTPQNEASNLPTAIAAQKRPEKSGKPSQEAITASTQVVQTEELATANISGTAILSNIKSRRESQQGSPLLGRSVTAPISEKPNEVEETARMVSQPVPSASNSGTKRQRVVTPVATRAIDDEDEPRTSPSSRKVSRASAKQEGPDARRILSNLTNV